MRPPVPPPVPPAVPPPPVDDGSPAGLAGGLPVVVRRATRPRRSGQGPLVGAILLLASAAVAIAAVVAWPTSRGRRADQAAARASEPIATPEPASPVPPAAVTRPPAATVASAGLAEAARPEPVEEAAEPSRAPERRREPTAVATAPPPAADTAASAAESGRERADRERLATAAVDRALAAALAALRRSDGPAARESVDTASDAVGDDAALRSRVDRWRLLVDYAAQLDTHRRQASASAAKGREYEIGGRTIGIVELTPESYAYKAAGTIKRGPRTALPRPIERAILEAWFAGDGRAANHIFLGIDRLLEPRPDLAGVRREWDTALRGEPATAPLMPLLEDPLFVAPARQ